ncbi:hypothetical protein ACFQV4_21715 [Streptomyces thermocarboxydus]
MAAAVLASIGVGVYALTDDDGGRSTATSQQRGGQDDGRGAPEDGAPDREGDGGGDGGDDSRRVESGSVTDSLSGISLPVPDGWYGEELQVGASLTSKESYDCPGDTSKSCVKGGVYSAALVLGTRGDTAEEVAKADISANAEESYGGEAYGRITSHDVLASKAVTVAGQKGYLVRWKAVTQEGSDGFVQSSRSRPPRVRTRSWSSASAWTSTSSRRSSTRSPRGSRSPRAAEATDRTSDDPPASHVVRPGEAPSAQEVSHPAGWCAAPVPTVRRGRASVRSSP